MAGILAGFAVAQVIAFRLMEDTSAYEWAILVLYMAVGIVLQLVKRLPVYVRLPLAAAPAAFLFAAAWEWRHELPTTLDLAFLGGASGLAVAYVAIAMWRSQRGQPKHR